jgi:hypothetical protein
MFTPFAFVKSAAAAAPAFSYLLNEYPGAYAAYSLRQLSSSYSGPAITVRRSSNNQETDIGFINGVLDTGSLLSWCGAGDGFVSYWYDQSGNSRHLEQTSTAEQPRIVLTGSIETSNGKPAIFVNTDRRMFYTISGGGNGTNPSSFFTVVTPVDNSTTSLFGISVVTSNSEFLALGTNGVSQSIAATSNDSGTVSTIIGLSTSNNTMYLATNLNINQTSTGRKLFVNSTNEYTSTIAQAEQFFTSIRLNRMNNSDLGVGIAKWTEMIHYKTSQTSSRSGIETNINNYYSIY